MKNIIYKINIFIVITIFVSSCRNPLGDSSIVDEGYTEIASSNTAPTISDITNQTIYANRSTIALAFTIHDAEDALDCVTSMSMSSNNTTLIDDGDVVFSGTAPNCTVVFTPNSSEVGIATLTVSVSDGLLSAQDIVLLTVSAAAASTIQGFVINGQTLSVLSYGGGASLTDEHQWYSDGVPVSGAVGTTYVVTSDDEGTNITLRVNGSSDSNILSNFYPGELSITSWVDPAFSTTNSRIPGSILIETGTGASPVISGGVIELTLGQKALHVTTNETSNPEVILVARIISGGGQFFDFRNPSDDKPLLDAIAGQRARARSDLGGSLTQTSNSSLPAGFSLLSYSIDGTTLSHRISGSVADSVATSSTLSGLVRIGLGTNGYSSTTASVSSDIKEVITTETLSSLDRKKVEGYLSWKHGIEGDLPVDHPYRNTAP